VRAQQAAVLCSSNLTNELIHGRGGKGEGSLSVQRLQSRFDSASCGGTPTISMDRTQQFPTFLCEGSLLSSPNRRIFPPVEVRKRAVNML
jgi:hypothetical protein